MSPLTRGQSDSLPDFTLGEHYTRTEVIRLGSRPTAALLLLFAASSPALLAESSDACAVCHPKIYESYRRTGMGRSFYRPGPSNTVEDYSRKNNSLAPGSSPPAISGYAL